jgi:hypothetical protein
MAFTARVRFLRGIPFSFKGWYDRIEPSSSVRQLWGGNTEENGAFEPSVYAEKAWQAQPEKGECYDK